MYGSIIASSGRACDRASEQAVNAIEDASTARSDIVPWIARAHRYGPARASAARGLKDARRDADAPPVSETGFDDSMRYLRVTLGDGDDVAMTLYEVDENDWVHRMVQLHPQGSRFAPEDVLMCRPVNSGAMLSHACTEAIERDDFDLIWAEVAGERSFLGRVLDPTRPWDGFIDASRGRMRVRWQPSGPLGGEWTCVPGVPQLYVLGDETSARSICAAVFMERAISWSIAAGVGEPRRAAA